MFEQLTSGTGIFTLDLIVLVGFLVVTLLYAGTLGKDYGVTMINALYIAALPFFVVPQIVDSIPKLGMAPHVSQIVFLGIFFLVVFFVISRNGFFESPMVPSLWEIGVFATLFVGLFFAISFSFIPQDITDDFSVVTRSLFGADVLLTFWLLAPVGFWILIRGD